MKKIIRTVSISILAALSLSVGGCFTGVESTPRINDSDVRRNQAAGTTSEQLFLSDIKPAKPSEWQVGRAFKVTNDRISLIFTSASDRTDNLAGHTIYYEQTAPAIGLTGDNAEISFRSDDGRRLYYRPDISLERLDTIHELQIPFTVDLDVVSRIDSTLRGNSYYVRTPAWYSTTTRQALQGMRHIEVRIDSVSVGDENFLAAVYFTPIDPIATAAAVDSTRNCMVYMSIGTSRAATRNFDTLFAFENPRKAYPEIKDDVWQLIVRSRVRAGMTREECRLALGTPPNIVRIPTNGGMVEQWTYSDGIYLIFEDGFLSRYRR